MKMVSKKYEDWAEKYRPQHLRYVVGNEDIIADLKRFVENINFPNILALGPPGIGKTTTMRLLVRQLGVPCLEINASIDSGISVVREQIIDYAYQMDISGAPFKVVMLDQVDRLTQAAQQASLQLTEEVSGYCKFLATSNDARNLFPAFTSRFKTYKFQPIIAGDMVQVMRRICKKERIKVKSDDLYYISKASRGDLRQAIKTLQAAAEGKDKLSRDDVKAWTWMPPYKKIRRSLKEALAGNFTKSVKIADEILHNTQPKWFFTGITDRLYKGKSYSEQERILVSLYLPEGNPHALVDSDVYRFLAKIAREFE